MDKELAKSIGGAARRARKALELTQEDAAERIGVSVEFYARIERGNSLPSVPTFVRISSALGVSADTLIGREQAQAPAPSWQSAAQPTESPEIRRVLRLLRKASSGTLRVVTLLVKEMERQRGAPDSDDDAGGASG